MKVKVVYLTWAEGNASNPPLFMRHFNSLLLCHIKNMPQKDDSVTHESKRLNPGLDCAGLMVSIKYKSSIHPDFLCNSSTWLLL